MEAVRHGCFSVYLKPCFQVSQVRPCQLKSPWGCKDGAPPRSDPLCNGRKAGLREAWSLRPWLGGNLDDEGCGRRAEDTASFSGKYGC